MALPDYTYEDVFGGIINHGRYLEIRWYDATADMTGDQFNGFLKTFADQCKPDRPGCLVDAVQFDMPSNRMSMGWRDEHIVPIYNKAGVKRFAFIMPAGMPLIGQAPAKEGPADYLTAYFRSRAEAIAWLTG